MIYPIKKSSTKSTTALIVCPIRPNPFAFSQTPNGLANDKIAKAIAAHIPHIASAVAAQTGFNPTVVPTPGRSKYFFFPPTSSAASLINQARTGALSYVASSLPHQANPIL